MRLQERGRQATLVIGVPYDLAGRLIAEARRRDIPIGETVAILLGELWPAPLRIVDTDAMNERGGTPSARGTASATIADTIVDGQDTA